MQKSGEFKAVENLSLRGFNTFGIDAKARYYLSFHNTIDIQRFINTRLYNDYPWLILGGGSNILFTSDFPGLVIHPLLKGYKIISESGKEVMIEVSCGEVWDDFVRYCADKSYYGIENLSLIPGFVGASPIQNIGAYGAEVSEVIEVVKGIDIETAKLIEFRGDECRFGYRDSIFKRDLKNKFLITSVVFRLLKDAPLKMEYGNLKEEVLKLGDISIQNVRQAVIRIRNSKLPDPAVAGNAGSFFKNPIISSELHLKIKNRFPEVPSFGVSDGYQKIPAGWLIEKCGWKGKISGNTGVHDKQALILINRGNASGKEIFDFSEDIMQSVYSNFGILLEREVNII